jgi:superfamily II DNA helicase RecQ
MAALVRHFGDVEDASRACGICDVCDPAGAVLRLFRRPTAAERELAQAIADELRAVDYKASGTLQRNLDGAGKMSRSEFDGLLDAMVRAGLIEIEEAEFEKDGAVIRFRKVRVTPAGLEMRAGTPVEFLISDGVVEEFGGRAPAPARARTVKAVAKSGAGRLAVEPVRLTQDGEALAGRLREWRAAEAKRLGVPAYVVLHDRTLTALARVRPTTPRQLLEISGMGPAKVERFGEAILALCGAAK